jgi:glycosyltransferase involved in cell wall biosynthesis
VTKKISIIIPCYNVENFIDRCANSLFNQTIGLENLELIFVNDASTDHTMEHLVKLEELHPEDVMVINSIENLRQGGARNIGLQYASCDYIGYVDSDDWVEPTMYEKLYEKMIQYDCDIVSCDFKRVEEEQQAMGRTGKEDQLIIIDTKEKRKELLINGFGYGGIWSKIYKRNIIQDNQILFPEHLAYEDNYWTTFILLAVKRCYIVEEYLYDYFVNDQSTILSMNKKHHFDRLKIELMKLEELRNRGIYDQFYDEIEFNFLILFYVNSLNIIFMRFSYIPVDILNLMQRSVKENFPNFMNNKYIQSPENQLRKTLLNTVNLRLDETSWQEIKNSYLEAFSVNTN